MGLYARRILPTLTHWTMGQRQRESYRRRVAGAAHGRVLELGVGSGRNLPFYSSAVDALFGIDPSPELLQMARRAIPSSAVRKVELLEGSAEALPFDEPGFDTVVVTWSLCSIPHPARALAEARRVLKPGGRLVFAEHGLSPDPGVRRWQERLTPLWSRIAGGCHLNRKVDGLVQEAGFRVSGLELGYARGPRPMTYMYCGSAEAP